MPSRSIKKAFFFAFLFLGMAVFGLDKTSAFYLDSEHSPANLIEAGRLDFEISSSQDFLPENTCNSAERTIELFNQGNPFNYKIETTEISGDLCSYIILEANLDGGAAECTSNLVGFVCQGLNYPQPAGSPPHQWQITATLTEGAPEESVCSFKFLYSGWQMHPDLSGAGFGDEEEIENRISSGICRPRVKVLINKVYYDVDSEHGTEPANEWVELYNPNDFPVDISNWQICDNTACDTLPTSSIPALGFALISGSSSTWQYWETIPADVLKIVLTDGEIGGGLANTNDMLLLKDPDGTIIDQMNWGTPSSTWPNYNDQLWNPGLSPTGDGGISARVPTGTDTDTKADWKNLKLPQVSVTYPTGGTWYCNQNVTLRWTATNPNGPNSDLKITLIYIRDLDGNGVVSSGDGFTTIAQEIANSGNYNWRVSPCHYGYVWIKVIARGPENFMVSDSALSGRVFEPPEPEGENSEGIFDEVTGGEIDTFPEIPFEATTPQSDGVDLSDQQNEPEETTSTEPQSEEFNAENEEPQLETEGTETENSTPETESVNETPSTDSESTPEETESISGEGEILPSDGTLNETEEETPNL